MKIQIISYINYPPKLSPVNISDIFIAQLVLIHDGIMVFGDKTYRSKEVLQIFAPIMPNTVYPTNKTS